MPRARKRPELPVVNRADNVVSSFDRYFDLGTSTGRLVRQTEFDRTRLMPTSSVPKVSSALPLSKKSVVPDSEPMPKPGPLPAPAVQKAPSAALQSNKPREPVSHSRPVPKPGPPPAPAVQKAPSAALQPNKTSLLLKKDTAPNAKPALLPNPSSARTSNPPIMNPGRQCSRPKTCRPQQVLNSSKTGKKSRARLERMNRIRVHCLQYCVQDCKDCADPFTLDHPTASRHWLVRAALDLELANRKLCEFPAMLPHPLKWTRPGQAGFGSFVRDIIRFCQLCQVPLRADKVQELLSVTDVDRRNSKQVMTRSDTSTCNSPQSSIPVKPPREVRKSLRLANKKSKGPQATLQSGGMGAEELDYDEHTLELWLASTVEVEEEIWSRSDEDHDPHHLPNPEPVNVKPSTKEMKNTETIDVPERAPSLEILSENLVSETCALLLRENNPVIHMESGLNTSDSKSDVGSKFGLFTSSQNSPSQQETPSEVSQKSKAAPTAITEANEIQNSDGYSDLEKCSDEKSQRQQNQENENRSGASAGTIRNKRKCPDQTDSETVSKYRKREESALLNPLNESNANCGQAQGASFQFSNVHLLRSMLISIAKRSNVR